MTPFRSLLARARRSPGPRRGSERGVTIVEMLVASFILGVGVMGVASLFVASARSIAIADSQADATDVASGELEIIRSIPYGSVGIASSADGYVPTFSGRRTVTEPERNMVDPLGSVTRDGTVFDVERSVTWAPAGTTGREYKVVVVTVRWDTNAGERAISVQTGMYEGADRG